MPRTRTSHRAGFLALDKPAGWTSHDVVARVRKISGVRRVGHAGTLDPFATGLLIIGVGKATRLIQYVQSTIKTYQATFKLGEETDTFDLEGQVTASSAGPPWPSGQIVEEIVARYVGRIEQTPPAYSAVHVDGKRAYDLARSGIQVDIPAREVHIHALDITHYDPPYLGLAVICSTGTYIRSLARDIGRDLGTYAYCDALRRTQSGTFHVDDAVSLEDLDADNFEERWSEQSFSPDSAVLSFPALTLSETQATAWYHGQSLKDVHVTAGDNVDMLVRVYAAGGKFAGLGQFEAGSGLRPTLVFTTD